MITAAGLPVTCVKMFCNPFEAPSCNPFPRDLIIRFVRFDVAPHPFPILFRFDSKEIGKAKSPEIHVLGTPDEAGAIVTAAEDVGQLPGVPFAARGTETPRCVEACEPRQD